MQKRQIIIILVAVVIVVAGVAGKNYLASLKKDPPKRSLPETHQYTKVDKVKYSNLASKIKSSGRVRSGKRVVLSPEVQGKLTSSVVALKEGASFNKGQLLFKIDDTEAQLQLKAQKSNFLTALASILPDIKIDYPDDYPAWKDYFDGIDIEKDLKQLPEVKDSKLKTLLAVKNILNQYYSIKSTEARLDKYSFYAPFNGSFSKVMFEAGTIVNPGAQIAEIIESTDMEIELPLTTDQVPWIKVGGNAQILDSKGQTYDAKVKRISSFLDATTQSIKAYLSFTNPGNFYEGMYVDVLLEGPEVENVFEIPRAAIFDKNQVYILSDSSLQAKKVEVVKQNEYTAFIRGIDEGKQVVTEALLNTSSEVKYLPAKLK